MADDGRGEDVRAPQANSVATNRRRTQVFALTVASQTFQLRAAPADSEAWVTLYLQDAAISAFFHVGPSTIPAATANDWQLPPATERSYKLAHGETHISVAAASGTPTLKVYISGD
ncbi:MAG TPA: hypothetical protein VJ793_05775 [Anaerolineae bacterium]|nr:hypothetical protein [Anaerolineae bacterium]